MKKLSKALIVVTIILVITIAITVFIILNKGVVFGYRLVKLSDETAGENHSIEVVAENTYLTVENGTTEIYVNIDGNDVTDGFQTIVSDEDVISVDGTTVTALSIGTATITVISDEYEIAEDITINVIQTISRLSLDSEYRKIDVDEQSQMSYSYEPSDATIDVSYASSDEDIATVDSNGIVTGIAPGESTIIATDNITGKTASFTIEVMY